MYNLENWEEISYEHIRKSLKQLEKPGDKRILILSTNELYLQIVSDLFRYAFYNKCGINALVKTETVDSLANCNIQQYDYIILDFLEYPAWLNDDFFLKIEERYNKIDNYKDCKIVVLKPDYENILFDSEKAEVIRNKIDLFVKTHSHFLTIDKNKAVYLVGINHMYDDQKAFAYGLPYSICGLKAIALELVNFMQQDMQQYKKCLILDCDGVLWGGTLDEDGIEKIQLDTSYPGVQYLNFQREVLELYKKGVAIALLSKNDEEDVKKVLNRHPFMLIREEQLASYRINWQSKVKNLQEISNELNISFEDMVYIDDSVYEITLLREAFPSLCAIHFQNNAAHSFARFLRNCGLFKREQLTQDDLNRNRSYQLERVRKRYMKEVDEKTLVKDFQVRLTAEVVNEFNIYRLSQLTYRTNRCNLTCKKFTVEQLYKLLERKNYYIRCFKLSDKIGDYGYIASIIIDLKTNFIEGFYLSCRAINRGVEALILDQVYSEIGRINLKYEYINNEKNFEFKQQVDSLLKKF